MTAPFRALATLALAFAAAPVFAGGAPFGVYEVEASAGGRELTVEARFGRGAGESLEFEDGMGPFVMDAQLWTRQTWRPLALDGDRLAVPGCARAACRLRYRVLLENAGRSIKRHATAFVNGAAVLAPPSTWLARPSDPPPVKVPAVPRPDRNGEVAPGDARYHVHVRTPPGTTFVSGLFRVRGVKDTYAINDLTVAPYSAFGDFDVRPVEAGGGTVDVAIGPGPRGLSPEALRAWVQRCAKAVADYYGRAPLPRYAVMVLPGGRRPVGYGTAMGHGGGAILVWVGEKATEADLAGTWMLVHEMVHLGFPNVPSRQGWMEEGLATYAEEVARVRAGWITEEQFWSDLRTGFPKGLLRPGEQGLDDARRWGPRYWGGALFWFLADVEIRERTQDKRGLEDALRGVQDAGGSIAVWWPAEKVLKAADAAVGVPVLSGLYDRFGRAYMEVDLEALWTRVGVAGITGAGERAGPLGRGEPKARIERPPAPLRN